MIKSVADLKHYNDADLAQAGLKQWRPWSGFRYPILAFQRLLRRTEYVVNCRQGKIWKPYVFLCLFRLRGVGIRLGFTIHPNVFGPGLSIAHWGTIVTNPNVRIGKNCRIHPSTSLGESDGGSPRLGDDCYVGPGAKLFGPIELGDRVKIGANAVVNKSFGSDVVLAGVPARVVKHGAATEKDDRL